MPLSQRPQRTAQRVAKRTEQQDSARRLQFRQFNRPLLLVQAAAIRCTIAVLDQRTISCAVRAQHACCLLGSCNLFHHSPL